MDGDVSKIIEEIGKDSLGKALKDFEQADTITFRSKEDKEEYIKAISNFPNIKIDDSKYQVKPNEYFAKFAKPMNDPNKSGENQKRHKRHKRNYLISQDTKEEDDYK